MAVAAAFTSSLLTASPVQAFDNSVYQHDYVDPYHPQCGRHIQVTGNTFHYSGTAVGPKDDPVRRGCTPKEIQNYGLRKGSFDGVILDNGRISAGDGIHEGFWEPAGVSDDVDGIRWNDGNKWIVKQKATATKIGEVIFWSYLGFSTLAGVKGLVDGIERRRRGASNK